MNEDPPRRHLKKRFQRSFADIFIRFQEGSHCWKVILSTIFHTYLRICKVTRYYKWWVHLKSGCKINIDLCGALRILDKLPANENFCFVKFYFTTFLCTQRPSNNCYNEINDPCGLPRPVSPGGVVPPTGRSWATPGTPVLCPGLPRPAGLNYHSYHSYHSQTLCSMVWGHLSRVLLALHLWR